MSMLFGQTLSIDSGDGATPLPYDPNKHMRLTIRANAAGIYIGDSSFLNVGNLPATGFELVSGREYTFEYGPPEHGDNGEIPAVATSSGSNVTVSYVVTWS